MFRVKIEQFEPQISESGYASDKNNRTIFEQETETLDVSSIIAFINGVYRPEVK